ncbi:MAG: hypothetical protein IT361_03035 [Gemmatimonadaceae bacterium]|nr:hypothetical protein [Gemmatimonadaceae bacterium]
MTQGTRTFREGIVLGIIGYATVAAFFAIFDFLAARGTLFTVNLLGQTVFRGVRDPAVLQLPIPLDMVAIGLFNALHLVASLTIGLIVAWLVAHLEGPPAQRRLAWLLIGAGFFVTIFGIGLLSASFRALLPFWSVVLANVAAVIVGGVWMLRHHPRALASLRHVLPTSAAGGAAHTE